MKKMKLSLLLLTLLAAIGINAQEKGNLYLGPVVGFGHSWISGSEDIPTGKRKFQPSFNAGGRLTYSINSHLTITTDITFRTEGSNYKANNYYFKNNFNYIRLDPKIIYFFGKNDKALRLKMGVGPSFGLLLGGKIKTDLVFATPEVLNLKDYYKDLDFGLSSLLGFNYRLRSKTWLNVDAVYNHGISDIAKSNPNDAIQNRSLFLNVGITFGIGHAGEKGQRVIDEKRPKN